MEADRKAYDIKRLGELLKAEGLEVLEDGAEGTYRAMKKWLQESAKISKTLVDDMVMPFLDNLDDMVLDKLDDINPADNASEAEAEPASEATPEPAPDTAE